VTPDAWQEITARRHGTPRNGQSACSHERGHRCRKPLRVGIVLREPRLPSLNDSPNVPEYALAFYGATAAGGIVTTVNPLYTVDELACQLQDTWSPGGCPATGPILRNLFHYPGRRARYLPGGGAG